MRVLYVAYRYDYGKTERGYSFEHFNFFESLTAMGHEVDYFDLGGGVRPGGEVARSEALLDRVRATGPDVVFSCLVGADDLVPAAVREISTALSTPTVNWFCDDHWRFDDFTALWAPAFSWATTTDAAALAKYAEIGYRNVIKTQWAAADSLYRPSGRPLAYDVTFVGQVYGDRPDVIRHLRRSGLPVEVWGTGWDVRLWHRAAGRVPVLRDHGGRELLRRVQARTRADQTRMLAIFEQSRVNLNLVATSQGGKAQIKGRTFEVPACGGFLLEGRVAGLEEYFDLGREIVVYDNLNDMTEQAAYYLRHEDEARRIAAAGQARVHAEHTYRHRFTDVFRKMGLT